MREITAQLILGDCHDQLKKFGDNHFAACITDPPYNYEFIGKRWDKEEIDRRTERVKNSKTLVKNIPYGSGLAGGVRDARWYKRNRENIIQYQEWCTEWGKEVYRTIRPGGFVLVFNSTRTIAQVQVALESVGFYSRDILVWRRSSGIPKGFNYSSKLAKLGRETERHLWAGWHSCLRNEWEAVAVLQKPLITNYQNTVENFGVGLMRAEGDGIEGFQSNILEGFRITKGEKVEGHCTVKPISLMKKLVDMVIPELNRSSMVVLDPFAGSGTTLLAAKMLGIPSIGIEINEEYLNIAETRLKGRSQAEGGGQTIVLNLA